MNLTQIVDGFTGLEHTLGLEPIYEDVIQLLKSTDLGITPTLIVVYNGQAVKPISIKQKDCGRTPSC